MCIRLFDKKMTSTLIAWFDDSAKISCCELLAFYSNCLGEFHYGQNQVFMFEILPSFSRYLGLKLFFLCQGVHSKYLLTFWPGSGLNNICGIV